jgi:predicted transcriptional regulator
MLQHDYSPMAPLAPLSLTQRQRDLLQALVARYAATERPVSRETLAAALDCPPQTLDHQITPLTARQLIESFRGPTGGYRPMARTYEVLACDEINRPATTPVTHDDQHVESQTVRAIEFPAVHDPTRWQAVIRLDGPLTDIESGETISVGPTPVSQLRVSGTVDETRPATGTLILTLDALHAPAETHEEQTN